ncbi:2-oxoacid:acceptor oxidoreductase family protein [Patescibacteria group bacterium]
MKFNKDTFEIIFFARAGQGGKSAAEVLAQSAMLEGKYIQAFPYYGPERSGAPTKAYVRISSDPIRTHEPIVDPDLVVVLDDTLLGEKEVISNLDEEESLIVNTEKTNDEIARLVKGFKGNIKTVDASGIAIDVLEQSRPNGVILGKIAQVTDIVKLESLQEQFKMVFGAKLPEELISKNLIAMEKGFDSI